MMRYFLLALPLLLSAACQGQTTAPKKQTKARTAPVARTDSHSLLWKIEKSGRKPSYLFGTIHLICRQDYLWNDSMKAALAASEEVCFEMDLDDPGLLLETMSAMMGGGKQGGDEAPAKSMRELLTKDEYKRYRSFLKDTLGMDGLLLTAAESGGPMVVQMMAMTKTLDCSTPESYEQNIMAEAHRQHKEIVGLETASEQLSVLNGVPADTSAKSIMRMVDSFETSRREFRQLVATYRRQDLPALASMMEDQGGSEMGDLKPFLDDRNQKWISKMEGMMKDKSMFFAVGAGHLWGTNGVIQLLRKQGYTVTPVYQ
jgi:uncharacterized protein